MYTDYMLAAHRAWKGTSLSLHTSSVCFLLFRAGLLCCCNHYHSGRSETPELGQVCIFNTECHKSYFWYKFYSFLQLSSSSTGIQPTQTNAVGGITDHGPSELTAKEAHFLSLSLAVDANQASFFRQLKCLPFHAKVSRPSAAVLYFHSAIWSLSE